MSESMFGECHFCNSPLLGCGQCSLDPDHASMGRETSSDSRYNAGYAAGYAAATQRAITDQTATLLALVDIIDDPEFDAFDTACVLSLLGYINTQCRAVCGGGIPVSPVDAVRGFISAVTGDRQ